MEEKRRGGMVITWDKNASHNELKGRPAWGFQVWAATKHKRVSR